MVQDFVHRKVCAFLLALFSVRARLFSPVVLIFIVLSHSFQRSSFKHICMPILELTHPVVEEISFWIRIRRFQRPLAVQGSGSSNQLVMFCSIQLPMLPKANGTWSTRFLWRVEAGVGGCSTLELWMVAKSISQL